MSQKDYLFAKLLRIERLEAERDRLREALSWIARGSDDERSRKIANMALLGIPLPGQNDVVAPPGR